MGSGRQVGKCVEENALCNQPDRMSRTAAQTSGTAKKDWMTRTADRSECGGITHSSIHSLNSSENSNENLKAVQSDWMKRLGLSCRHCVTVNQLHRLQDMVLIGPTFDNSNRSPCQTAKIYNYCTCY